MSVRKGATLPGLLFSLVAHLGVFGAALAWAAYSPPRVVPEKPIVARLVRLGEERDERLLPRLPSKESAPAAPSGKKTESKPEPPPAKPEPKSPEPAPPTPPKAESPPAKAAPKPDLNAAPVDPPTPKKAEKPKAEKPKAEDPKAQSKPTTPPAKAAAKATEKPKVDEDAERRRRMREALEGITTPAVTGPTGSTPSTPEGRPDGDPAGTADSAEEGDRYIALVVQALKRNYSVPSVLTAQERMYLSCRLRLVISASGQVASWKMEESSGNAHFDRAVERAVREAIFPPPPPAFNKAYGRDGFGFEFKP